MKKSILLLMFLGVMCLESANGKTPSELTDADWMSAAKAALNERSTNELTFVVDDRLPLRARNALERIGKVVRLADVPDEYGEFSGPEYIRVFQFQQQGDRIEFLQGSVYPKAYQAGDCRFTGHLFVARTAMGNWKQDGPSRVQICAK
ncbi:hypothetical protein ACFOY5_23240 [Massilia aurea]|uniref:hypothetical protein n=1 Tax=Massilia aurea TaxID=373040 RepID=UPI0019B6A68E|nr:hypothetical protein [Massilia aurea]MBD8544439.1 hypothetical protein [Oxalobacteraceae sp. CFBP 8761]MBD8565634.1 hypothetical protein [Oxalobacteraceae sp. CFBP 8763]MCS0708428.1 hypothetical protein [Massilia aurea]